MNNNFIYITIISDKKCIYVLLGLQQDKKEPAPDDQTLMTLPQHQPQQGYDIQGLTGPQAGQQQGSTGYLNIQHYYSKTDYKTDY